MVSGISVAFRAVKSTSPQAFTGNAFTMTHLNAWPIAALLGLTTSCSLDGGKSDQLGAAFSDCLRRDSRCIADLNSTTATAAAHPLTQSAPEAAAAANAASAYWAEPVSSHAQPHWAALVQALERLQKTTKRGRIGTGGSSANDVLVIVPAAGDLPAGCTTWVGAYRDAGGFASAQQDRYDSVLRFDLRCSNGNNCGSAERPYRATIEIIEASADGATGTGSLYRYTDVPVRVIKQLLVAYTDSDLYPDAAKEIGPSAYCENRPAPCYAKSAGRGETLFAVLMNCSAGNGILQWGALSDEAN